MVIFHCYVSSPEGIRDMPLEAPLLSPEFHLVQRPLGAPGASGTKQLADPLSALVEKGWMAGEVMRT
jgi:hypothetical protein